MPLQGANPTPSFGGFGLKETLEQIRAEQSRLAQLEEHFQLVIGYYESAGDLSKAAIPELTDPPPPADSEKTPANRGSAGVPDRVKAQGPDRGQTGDCNQRQTVRAGANGDLAPDVQL